MLLYLPVKVQEQFSLRFKGGQSILQNFFQLPCRTIKRQQTKIKCLLKKSKP